VEIFARKVANAGPGWPTLHSSDGGRLSSFVTRGWSHAEGAKAADELDQLRNQYAHARGKVWCFRHQLLLGRQRVSPNRETDQPGRFEEREDDILRRQKKLPR
jgi:hypothetical protein